MEGLLSPKLRFRAWTAMKYQNRGIDPFIGGDLLVVKSAFIVGEKIFFSRDAAEAWCKQTKGKTRIVKYDYSEAYMYYYPKNQ